MSAPATIPSKYIDDLDPVGQAAMRYEFSRKFLEDFQAVKPAMIVIDFCPDVRSGCIILSDGSIVTRNRWRVVKTKIYRENIIREIVPGTSEYIELWKDAVQRFASFVRSSVPTCKIVLHCVENATTYRKTDGSLASFPGAQELIEMNRWWSTLNRWFAENYADAVLDVWSHEVASYEGHHWGPWPVHFELDYHQKASVHLRDIARKLTNP